MNELLIATQKTSVTQVDPYYNLVSLHLKGDVNTGRDYNAFSDASSNNFRLTNSGDVRGSSFSPYGTSWSNLFSSSSYLSLAANANLAIGTSSFTVEAFFYLTSSTTNQTIFSPNGANNGLAVNISTATTIIVDQYGSGGLSYTVPTIALNTWNHIAVVRDVSTSTTRVYLNGTESSSGGKSDAKNYAGQSTLIGTFSLVAGYYLTGYISNLRVVRGVAVYTGNFTVPTSPLTATQSAGTNIAAITGTQTSLLTCQSNRFVDNSTNSIVITPTNSPSVQAFSPFLETDTTTGSGYFDGNADYLDVTSASFNPAGAFTVEFWFYPTDNATTYQGLVSSWPDGASPATGILLWKSSSIAEIQIGNASTGGTQIATFTWATYLNQWNHIALVRNSSNSCAVFLNGNRLAAPVTKAGAPGSSTLTVGRLYPNLANYYFQGNISNLHFVSGSSLYDPALSTIPVPTVPITKVTNTALLTLQERGAYNTIGFQDESEYQHVITRPSGANVAQGTFSPFSNAGWSNYFVANNANNVIAATAAGVAFGTGDFCQEFFLYANSYAGVWRIISYVSVSGTASMVSQLPDVNLLTIGTGAGAFNTGIALPTKIWFHLVYTRQSGRIRIFVDGVLQYNVADTTNYTTSQSVYIGGYSGYSQSWDGYISNARIIKGSVPAAYQTSSTTNGTTIFTPPTSPLTAVTGTELLTCQSNRFFDANTQTTEKIITLNGSPSVQPFSPFKPVAYDPAVHGGSGYFDGNLDYIQSPTDPAFQMGTGDYTLECWAYFTATPPSTFAPLVDLRRASPNYVAPCLEVSNTLKLQLRDGSTGTNPLVGATTLTLNTWHHLAITRQSGTTRCFVNGVLDGTATNTTNFNSTVGFTAGASGDNVSGGYYFPGYLSSVRVLKGTAVYTGNFVPPSGPLPLLGNTSLLLNFTNAGVIDSTGKNVIETVGNAGVVTTSIKKYGSGSMFFDGTGDYIKLPSTSELAFGTGDFTIEMWYYTTTTSGWRGLYSSQASDSQANTMRLMLDTTNTSVNLKVGGTFYTFTTTLLASQWNHIALVRKNGVISFYYNGQVNPTTPSDTTSIASNLVTIGANFTTGVELFTGNIDDLRITKGYARYTTGTGANANQMVFNGTNTLALPTKAHPDSGVLSTLTTSMVAPSTVDYLVVGGGGGGGRENFSSGLGGGGGAGGFITGATTVSAATNYVITVGGGGPGLTAAGTSNDGFPSSIVGGTSPSAFTIPGVVAAGGGGGGGGTSPGIAGRAGGSGGGGGTPSPSNGGAASPAGQGNAGGPYSATSPNSGGGGGGAGEAGNTDGQGEGGDGTASSISGSLVTYAGGGGGGASFLTKSGGLGGGGDGGNAPSGPSAQPGGTNTGGGGGGGFNSTPGGTSGAGGSGIVIIAYPSTFKPLKASLGLVYTIDTVTRAGYRVYKFIAGTGTISW